MPSYTQDSGSSARHCIKPGGTAARSILALAGVMVAFFLLLGLLYGNAITMGSLIGAIIAWFLWSFSQRIEISGDLITFRRLLMPPHQFPFSSISKVRLVTPARSTFHWLDFMNGEVVLLTICAALYSRHDLSFILRAIRSRSPQTIFDGTQEYLPRHDIRDENETEGIQFIDSNGFSRREVYGSPSDVIVWLGVVLGGPLLSIYALENYPLRNRNDAFYGYLALISYASAVAWMILTRRKAFGPHARLGFKIVITVGVAFPIAMLMYGVFFILNGKFHWKT
jgi:hypothetical protein